MKTVLLCITLCKYEDSNIILCNNAHTSITLCKYEDSNPMYYNVLMKTVIICIILCHFETPIT